MNTKINPTGSPHSAGIDYGLGRSNIDHETGIHYGIINAHNLPYWYESSEPSYAPFCGHCGNELPEDTDSEEIKKCPHCEHEFEEFERDEIYQQTCPGEYTEEGFSCSESESFGVWFFESPYFTYCAFCSPCAPGAGDLDSPMPEGEGVKTYCPGPDWFDDDPPFPIFSIETGKAVQ
jgi:hypothetical protein